MQKEVTCPHRTLHSRWKEMGQSEKEKLVESEDKRKANYYNNVVFQKEKLSKMQRSLI